jgi:protein TonB
MGATIAVHVGLAAAALLIPGNKIIKIIDPPMITTNVPLEADPPPVSPPPPEKTVERQQTIIDSIVKTGTDSKIIVTKIDTPSVGVIGGGMTIKETPPPPEPALTAARPDPRYADSFQPEYPPAMIRQGIEGFVKLRVFLDERGRVSTAELVEATAPGFWETTRRQALKYWRFSPALRDGAPVSSSQVITVRFRLSDLG